MSEYKYKSQNYNMLLDNSQWSRDFSNQTVDPYFLRVPLFRINGDWDPEDVVVYNEKLTSGKVTVEQQSFSGLSLEDRYIEGYVEDSSPWLTNIIDKLPFAKSRTLVHIQKPGQMHMLHMDANYGNGFWDYLGDTKKEKLARVMIMLDDWYPGQIMMFGGQHVHHWKKGDVIFFRWQDLPHGTANFGHTTRPLLLTTGEITQEFIELLASKDIKEITI